ncbi:MAG: cysteine desulfurase NifS [Prochloraceae cyanobacterium]
MRDCTYLDNNATTKIDDEVVAQMLPYLTKYYGNPSSKHQFGGQVAKAVRIARERVAALLGAKNSSEIVFTSCGTEGNNAAITSALLANPAKKQIVTTSVEHPAVLKVCQSLERRGYQVTYLSVNDRGQLNLDEVEKAITDETALVSVMYANNETGVIFPISAIGEIAKSKDAIFHVDAVQAVGKIPLNMQDSSIDLLSLSGHKIHAPKGIGALYVRRGFKFSPLIIGGSQERGRRGGTENVPGIVALGKAAELAEQNLCNIRQERTLRDRLESKILSTIPNTAVNGDTNSRLPNTTNIGFKQVESEAILLYLERQGIYASSGSACTSGNLEPSHVLKAMKVSDSIIQGSIRFSLSKYNTVAEIDRVCLVLPNIIENLRNLSSLDIEESVTGTIK